MTRYQRCVRALAFAGLVAGVLTGTVSVRGAAPVPTLTQIAAMPDRPTVLLLEVDGAAQVRPWRPTPLTVLLDFPRMRVGSVQPPVFVPSSGHAIVGVRLEPIGRNAEGVRVAVVLSAPFEHHVRADGHRVWLELGPASVKGAPLAVSAPARAARAQAPSASAPTLVAPQAVAPVTAQAPAPAPTAPAPVVAPAVSVPAPSAAPAGAGPTQKAYAGEPVTLDFQQADIRAVLRVFAEVSGLNIIIDPTIRGTVDVSLKEVPWNQALEVILRANALSYRIDGTVLWIAPRKVFEADDKQAADEQAARESREAALKRTPYTRVLSYARGEDVVRLLKDARVLTKNGQAQVDPRTNTIIITDVPAALANAESLIVTLDQPQPQVEIEARIVQANKSFARRLGVQWGLTGRVDPALGNTTPFAFPNRGVIKGVASSAASTNAVNLGAANPTSGVGLSLGAVNGSFNLDVALSAAEAAGNLRVLSTPRVSAQNNREAEITQGVQIPIQTVANNTVTVTFKDAALTLKVTPQISSAGTVIMQIGLENAQADFSRAVNGIPPINTQRANTQVLVGDGQTTVIGGIYTSQQQTSNDRTPGLSQLPLLKWLFRRDGITDDSSELLIFITPRIVKG